MTETAQMTAMEELRKAVEDAGPHPHFHLHQMEQLMREWPSLWNAVTRVLGEETGLDARTYGQQVMRQTYTGVK